MGGRQRQSPVVSRKVVAPRLELAQSAGVIDAVAGGYGFLPDSIFNRSVFSYEEGRNAALEFNADAAKQQLADAGWTDSDGNGFLDKDGQELAIDVAYLGTWSLMQGIAPIVYDNWRALGVNVTLVPLDDAAANTEIYENTSVEKSYDAFLGGWGLFGTEPDHYRNYLANETSSSLTTSGSDRPIRAGRTIAVKANARNFTRRSMRFLGRCADDSHLPAIGVYVFRSDLDLEAAEINGTFLTGLKFLGWRRYR